MGAMGLISTLVWAEERLTLPPAAVDAIGRWLVTLAAVGALLLPALGPLLDHHFAERQPGHNHVFLDQAPHEHLHAYEYAGHHHGEHDSPTDGVVIVTSYDAMGTGLADVTPPVTRVSRLLPELTPDKTAFGFDEAHKLPSGESVSPPTQPPRL